ncbi:MAG: triose-phosphate isomerase [Roseobacter sp.]
MPRKLAAGNWKMNGSRASLEMFKRLEATHQDTVCDIAICPPAHMLVACVDAAAECPVAIGAQNCHAAMSGAHTGDISAAMVAETGATYVITGHSERREAYSETDTQVHDKSAAAQAAGLTAIVCIGESLAQREAGAALPVIRAQLENSVPDGSTATNLVVAYEPIWAIGTGVIPTMEQIAEVHTTLRADLVARFGAEGNDISLLYGGSVKPTNAPEIFALDNVDGALVGGASLKAEDFSPIIEALDASA